MRNSSIVSEILHFLSVMFYSRWWVCFFFFSCIYLFFLLYTCIWLCWAFTAAQAFLGEQGCSRVAAWGLTAAASVAVEHSLQGAQASVGLAHALSGCAARLWSTGFIVVAHGLSCSAARDIFPDQGQNLSLLHWQVDSLPQPPRKPCVCVCVFNLN